MIRMALTIIVMIKLIIIIKIIITLGNLQLPIPSYL